MIYTLGGLIALAGLAYLALRLRRQVDAFQDQFRHPKGWLAEYAWPAQALRVADTHLAGARAGANVRLQFGRTGCLTLLRLNPRDGDPGYLARWEFWRPDEALARALLDLPARKVRHPKPDVLELVFGDDYLSFRNAMEQVFENRPLEEGGMHLTWNC